MTSDDLRHLLTTVAGEVSHRVELDEDRLVTRIRSSRRRRFLVTAVSTLAATAALAATGYAALPSGSAEAPVAPAEKVPVPTGQLPMPKCGAVIDSRFPPKVPSGLEGLTLTGQTITRAGNEWHGSLRFEATDPRALEWIGSSTIFWVVQNHTEVGEAHLTVPTPPSKTFQARITVRPCAAADLSPGPAVLYGKLFPGQHPITFFQVNLTR